MPTPEENKTVLADDTRLDDVSGGIDTEAVERVASEGPEAALKASLIPWPNIPPLG